VLADRKTRWLITRVELRIADLAMLVIPVMLMASPTNFGGTPAPGELNLSTAMLALGEVAIALGWLWIRRIARGEPEPEANDRFWRSRA
jgi:hypothetical protein